MDKIESALMSLADEIFHVSRETTDIDLDITRIKIKLNDMEFKLEMILILSITNSIVSLGLLGILLHVLNS